MGYYDDMLQQVKLPQMYRVKQRLDDPKIDDIGAAVVSAIDGCPGIDLVRGKTVALAVGSRGINHLVQIVRTCVQCLQVHGAQVYIVPAMGSHGGARAENQTLLLEHLGVSEQSIGVPVRSSMETVVVGYTEDGIPANFDRNASLADYTVTIARIKPHSSFRGRYESGMAKMNVIGLGKQKGADFCHQQGMANMGANLEKIGRVSVRESNLLFSLGLIENGNDNTVKILAVPAGEIMDREPALLEEAKSYLPSIPFRDLDVLLVDEFGKDITGTGMDSNIIQRFTSDSMPSRPFIKRLVTLRLTENSDGNASGFGLADISIRKVFESMSFEKTYPNSLTARTVNGCRIPMIMENDFDAVRAGVKTAPAVDYDAIRMVRIRNTLRLEEMEISEALLAEAQANPRLTVCSGPFLWKFNGSGTLVGEEKVE